MLENHFKKGSILVLVVVLVLSLSPMQVFGAAQKDTLDAPTTVKAEEEVEALDQPAKKIPSEKPEAPKETADKTPKSELEADPTVAALPRLDPEAKQAKESTGETAKQSEKEVAEEKTQLPADPRTGIINSATLNSTSPKSEELDNYLHTVMDRLISEDMTTYEQTKACYDYLVKNVRYGSHTANLSAAIGSTTCRAIYKDYGAVEGFGAVALSAKVGMCNAYASAFIMMANDIGLNAYLVKGYTRGAGGGFTYHEWAEVNINGTLYVFDPQLEQNLTRAGLGVDNVFCKTYSQVGTRYSKA